MLRAASVLLCAFAALLAATGMSEAAEVSQNITITITPATQSVGFDPAGFTFAPQATGTASPEQALTLTNTGTVSFPLANVAIAGANAGDFFQTNNCPNSLAVSGTCQISVIFVPMGTGIRTASVVATASGGGTYTASLSGTGAPGTTIMPAFYIAANGSDSNAGTLAAPFASLGKCQAAMQTGYKLCYLRAGTYALPSGGLTFGAADDNETWQYYPPDGIGSAVISYSSVAANTIGITSTATGITFDGLYFTNFTYIAIFSEGNNTTWINNVIDGNGTQNSLGYGLDVYGNDLLIANNTFKNINSTGVGGAGRAISFNSNGVTNSVIKGNLFACDANWDIFDNGGSTGNLIYNNNFFYPGYWSSGATTTNCGSLVDGNAPAIDIRTTGTVGDLITGNTMTGVPGYDVIGNGGPPTGANYLYISDNILGDVGNPAITLNGSNGTVIRRNTINSTGSVGLSLGNETVCPASSTANSLLVTNNSITSAYEPFWLTMSNGSTFTGNITNIGVNSVGNPSPHYQSAISFLNWQTDNSCSITHSPNNSANVFEDNTINSTNSAAEYGAYYESGQTGNTISHNILFPYGSPGTAAIKDNSGGSNTAADNQTTSGGAVTSAPPLVNAGPSQIVAGGQVVTLNGSATANFPSGTTSGITYAWTQVSGTAVTINNPSSAIASFTAPAPPITQAQILVFKLTATNSNGSTYDEVMVGLDPSLSPGAQSRDDTPVAASDMTGATRHHSRTPGRD